MSLEDLLSIKVKGALRMQSEKAEDIPANIVVITKQQIKERGYTSLLAVLQDLPSVKVDYGVDPRWMNDVTIRGVRYMDKFLILLNGVRINSPGNDIIPIMENYPVNFAQRIEVIFGPGSALYGADAFSGVINIVTQEGNLSLGGEAAVSYGTQNHVLGNFTSQQIVGKNIGLQISGQFSYDQQPELSEYYPKDFEGIHQILEQGTFPTVFGNITPKTRVSPIKSNPLLGYGLNVGAKWKALHINYFGNYSRVPSSTANRPTNNVYNRDVFFGHYINMLNATYDWSLGNVKASSFLTGSRYDLDNRSNFRNVFTNMEPAYLFAYSQSMKAEQLLSYQVSDAWSLSGGVSAEWFESMPRSNDLEYPITNAHTEKAIIAGTINPQHPKGLSANLIRVFYQNYGGFLQSVWKPSNQISVTTGLRYDYNTRFDPTFNPRAGFVWKPGERWTLKAMYGRAYLAPSPQYMYDRYGSLAYDANSDTYSALLFQLPNEKLNPQTVNTYELNTRYRWNSDLVLWAGAYFSHVKGIISPVLDSEVTHLYPNNTYQGIAIQNIQVNANLGQQKVYGATARANYAKVFSDNSSLNVQLNYSYIMGEIDIDESGPLPARNLPGISNHMLKGIVSWQWRNWAITPSFYAFSAQHAFNEGAIKPGDNTHYQELPGYFLAHFMVKYSVEHLNFFVKCENLLDARYRNVNIGAAPQGNAVGSAQVEFAKGAPQYPRRFYVGFSMDW